VFKPYIAKRFFSVDFLNALKNTISEFKPDVILAESLYTAQYFNEIKTIHIPKIFRAHNVEAEIWYTRAKTEHNVFKYAYYYFLSNKLKKFEIDIAQKSDLIAAITSVDAAYFQQITQNKNVISLPTGFEICETQYRDIEAPNYLFIGALDWFPNIEALNWLTERVWPLIVKQIPSAKLHIAGRNPSKKNIEKWQKIKNCIFHGQVENANSFLEKGKIVLVPLFSGSGIRIKILQAMASGLPVVATSKAAIGLGTKNLVNIRIADTASEYAKCAIELHNNKQMYERIHEESFKYIVQYHNSKKLVAQLATQIEKLINNNVDSTY
jgi:glycosyltransferase involved in cell wall biosynthesis